MLADLARIVPANPRLELVVGQPLVLHVALERLPATAGVALLTGPDLAFGFLPGVSGVLRVGVGARRPLLPPDVEVVSRVARLAVPADALARVPHRTTLIV